MNFIAVSPFLFRTVSTGFYVYVDWETATSTFLPEMFFRRRANVPAIDPRRDTHPGIIRMLIDAGAQVDQADYPTGNESIDELLRRHGSSE
jgi:hypothetical protein